MRGKKIEFALVLVILMALLWFMVFRSYTGVDEKNEQLRLIEEADYFAEQELYIRAIPYYKEALKMNAGEDRQEAIEEKLLQVYEKFQDYQAYEELVEVRIKENHAEAQEYIQVAARYLDSGSLQQAMNYIEEGLRAFPDNMVLKNLYEQNRYRYRVYNTSMEYVMPVSDVSRMPAFTGEAWTYINMSGDRLFSADYEEVTPFYTDSSGNAYAVIRLNNEYIVINEQGNWYSRDHGELEAVLGISGGKLIAQKSGLYGFYDLDFHLLSQVHQYDQITFFSCGAAAVKKGEKWGIISEAGDIIVDFTLDEVALNAKGQAFSADTAMVKKDGVWILIDTAGEQILEVDAAAVKAPESDGYIAIANEDGEWGFINRSGELVIDFQYEDAKSFSYHMAAAKDYNGWNYINVENEVVIDGDFKQAEPFINGIAQVMAIDSISFLSLEYEDNGRNAE